MRTPSPAPGGGVSDGPGLVGEEPDGLLDDGVGAVQEVELRKPGAGDRGKRGLWLLSDNLSGNLYVYK